MKLKGIFAICIGFGFLLLLSPPSYAQYVLLTNRPILAGILQELLITFLLDTVEIMDMVYWYSTDLVGFM
jgi:hypothetical protein